jgi:carboxymethylenebutenolidase
MFLRRIATLALTLTVIAAASSRSSAQDWAKARLEKSPRHGEWVQIKRGERTIHAFVVYPEVKNKSGALIMIHEIFGLSDWVRSAADQAAEAGYIAIAPDLLSGAGPNGGKTSDFPNGDGVREAISRLSPEQVMADLEACYDYVSKLPACNGKVGVTGFCWGGGQTMRYVTKNPKLKVAFPFYGAAPLTQEDVNKITAPIYGSYGENDARINSTIPDTEKMMKAAGKTYEPVIFTGGGHGFMRAGEDPAGSPGNKKAREEGWARLKKELKKHLS